MLVIYESREEIIVTTLENEAILVADYFFPNSGRNKNDYDRTETPMCSINTVFDLTIDERK